MLTSLVPIFKGKGDPLNPNSYRRINVLEHAFKLYEKILDGYMPGRGTVDAVFVLRRLTEIFISVDLEKAF